MWCVSNILLALVGKAVQESVGAMVTQSSVSCGLSRLNRCITRNQFVFILITLLGFILPGVMYVSMHRRTETSFMSEGDFHKKGQNDEVHRQRLVREYSENHKSANSEQEEINRKHQEVDTVTNKNDKDAQHNNLSDNGTIVSFGDSKNRVNMSRPMQRNVENNEYAIVKRNTELMKNGVVFYDLSQPILDNHIRCKSLSMEPVTLVCVHQYKKDFLTKKFDKDCLHEAHILDKIRLILQSDVEYGLIDIGANLGYYSLVAANMGHKVVAVDPLVMNVVRFHKAAKLSGIQKFITLLQNAISNTRGDAKIWVNSANIAASSVNQFCQVEPIKCTSMKTIFMDDILPFINFKKAILKIDVEGHEAQALQEAERLFNTVLITHIIMEFTHLRRSCTGEYKLLPKHNSTKVDLMVSGLINRLYVPHHPLREQTLEYSNCRQWPMDIIWVHENASYPAW